MHIKSFLERERDYIKNNKTIVKNQFLIIYTFLIKSK